MEKAFETLRITRERFLTIVEGHSLATLNEIPVGFNNNLLWNFGHAIVSTQLLVYGPAAVPPRMPAELIEKYRRGTKPDTKANAAELRSLLDAGHQTVAQLKQDYADGLFVRWTPYTTGFGVVLDTVEDAMAFVSVHEAMHLGYCLALKRTLG